MSSYHPDIPTSLPNLPQFVMLLWNARAVLDVYPEEPDFTCVGTTQKGLRCRNSFIKRQYLLQAGVVLDSISQISLIRQIADEARLLTILSTISWLTLCPRWHQKPGRHGQTYTVAFEWLRILRSEAEIYQGPIRQIRSVPTSSNSTGYLPSPPPTPSAQSSSHSQTRRSAVPSPETHHLSRSSHLSSVTTMTSSSWSPSRRSSTQLIGPEHSSPTQSTTGSLSSTSTPSRRTHASARPAREHGPVVGIAITGSAQAARDLNLNVTIDNAHINQGHPQPRETLHDSGPASAPLSRISQITPATSPPASTTHSPSSTLSGASTLVDNSPTTRNDLQVLLNRIESLETQLLQANNRSSSRSSRSSGVSSRPMRHTTSSPAFSTISNVSVSQPRSPNWLFLSSNQLCPSFPNGPLSTSSDSSTSPAIMTPPSTQTSSDSTTSPTIMTPSSSGSRTSTPIAYSPTSSSPPSIPTPSTWSILTRPGETSIRPRPCPSTNISCHICSQPLLTTTDTTAHCRSPNGCSQTYCTLCIGEWISSQLDDAREPSCPAWYVCPPWHPRTFCTGTDGMTVKHGGSSDMAYIA